MKKLFTLMLTVVAVFALVACTPKTVTANFDTNGGEEAEYAEQLVNGGDKLERVARPTKEGSDFIGWYANAKGTGSAFNFHVDGLKKNTTFYAKWQEAVTTTDTATVTYVVPEGATPVAASKTVKGKLMAAEPNQPALAGSDFVWWYTDAKFKKAFNLDGTIVTGDVTLYAKFETKKVTSYAGQIRFTISSTSNLNPYSETLATASTLMDYLAGNLYETDIDWEGSIAEGVATAKGVLAPGKLSESLLFHRVPLLAASNPVDVSAENNSLEGTVWEIAVKSGITFADGTPITAQTWVDSWQLLLDPKLKNARANLIYDSNQYLGVVGAREYFNGTETDFSKVGVSVKPGSNTLVLRLVSKRDVWAIQGLLEGASTGIVHVENFKAGITADGTRTTYGTRSNMPVSSGPYVLTNWEAEKLFFYEKNTKYVNAADYKIEKIRYDVINNQTAEINEFKAGNIDVAGVSGQYFNEFEKDPRLKQSPTTSTFRMALNYTDVKDADGKVTRAGNEFLKNNDMRRALYLAIDRQSLATGIRKPSIAQPGFLSNQYYGTEQTAWAYRESAAALDAYTALTDLPNGYDPVQAKQLFEKALTTFGSKNVKIEVTFFDSETNHQLVEWINDTAKTVFEANTGQKNAGKFELVKNAVSSDAINDAWDNKTYDITMAGWQGINFNPLSLLGQVFNPEEPYVANATEHLDPELAKVQIKVNIPYAKVALAEWTEKLIGTANIANLTEEVKTDVIAKNEAYNAATKETAEAAYAALKKVFTDAELFAETIDETTVALVASWIALEPRIGAVTVNADSTLSGGEFSATLNELFLMAYTELDFEQYEGKDLDFDILTAAVEKMLIEQVIAIPLTSSVSNGVYSERVQFIFNSYHARMGWGGVRYMSIVD